jgi:hypothetical protein
VKSAFASAQWLYPELCRSRRCGFHSGTATRNSEPAFRRSLLTASRPRACPDSTVGRRRELYRERGQRRPAKLARIMASRHGTRKNWRRAASQMFSRRRSSIENIHLFNVLQNYIVTRLRSVLIMITGTQHIPHGFHSLNRKTFNSQICGG